MSNNLGCYSVGDRKFSNKNAAVYESVITGKELTWDFYSDTYKKCIRNYLPNKYTLDQLYKKRAQQLRDSYDYLILNYSGGPDSHNVLMTFLNNNIHLDEIHVKYSQSVDAKLYTPNSINKGAENIFSEYDLVIKPVLEKIRISNPEIKITLHDVFDTDWLNLKDDFCLHAGHFTGAFEILRQTQYSKSIEVLSEKGKSIADIYGIDKPLFTYHEKCLYTFFSDIGVNVAGNRHQGKTNASVELFYWTPDMPEIVIEQAFVHYIAIRNNPSLLQLFDSKNAGIENASRHETIRRLTVSLVYSNWDNSKFQADKPVYYSEQGRSRDKYYIQHNEFQKYLEKYDYYNASWRPFMAVSSKPMFSNFIKIGYI